MDNNFKSIMRTKLAAVLRASSIFGGLDDEVFTHWRPSSNLFR